MVVNFIKGFPWLPHNSKKYEASIRVRYLKVSHILSPSSSGGPYQKLTVEIRWKGSSSNGLKALTKKEKKDFTKEEAVDQNGVVVWNEEFKKNCTFSGSSNRDDLNSWEVAFIVRNTSDHGQMNKIFVAGPAFIDLAKFSSVDNEQELDICVPLTQSSRIDCCLTLSVTLNLRELRSVQETIKTFQRSSTLPSSPRFSPSLKKGKSLRKYVSFSRWKSKKANRVEAISESDGSWEFVEVVSRDGSLKLQTQVFFATIDQRSEKAAGESACAALVVIISNWLHSNLNQMPNKSELDRLIAEGSYQWRKLCEDEENVNRFPNLHFDLETVIQSNICPISVASTTGFFYPEEMENETISDYLRDVVSFDSIWDEISESDPLIYIVSWNDHFFVLKVDADAFYVIDTLGERLYEGCNRAYMLKFDKETTIRRVPSEEEKKSSSSSCEDIVCIGKVACKEYIKKFLAELPIRQLQIDIKEGRKDLEVLLKLLQIDIHYTKLV